jgi:GT2 family glycosyltransferase
MKVMPLRTGTLPRVAVVVLNFNGLEDTSRCVRSLRELSYPNAFLVLVDNGSSQSPESPCRLACPNLRFLSNGRNLGFAGGNNRGIDLALAEGAEYVLVLNNDTTVHPDLVNALVSAFESERNLAVVGPVINYMDEPDEVMTDGVRFNPGPGTEFFARIPVPLTSAESVLTEVDIVNGCCMMVPAALLHEVGRFDEEFFIVHEESDFCLRARMKGYRNAVLGRPLVFHKGSSSFERAGRSFQRYYDARNLRYLLRRYSGRVPGTRSWRSSAWHHLKYCYYRYCAEMEAGQRVAARAVVDGLVDALRGVTGEYRPAARPGAAAAALAFGAGARVAGLRGLRPRP